MVWLTTLAPIILELLKIFFGGSSNSAKEQAAEELRAAMIKIRAAVQKSQDTEGDTSDIEDIINKGKQ